MDAGRGFLLGTLLSCCCLGGILLWLFPAILSAGGDLQVFVFVDSPLVTLGFGLYSGLNAMRTNRCAGLILGIQPGGG